MEKLKVEYLVIINTENSFCNSKRAFNNLLSSFDDISISKNKIKHNGLEVSYELQTGEIQPNSQRFFHLKITCLDSAKIEAFQGLLKAIRGILNKASNKPPQKIWDDISKYYSIKAYPFIHDIENMMRKLITKFMLINIGLGWEKEAIPEAVKRSSRTKPKDSNYLYEVDFIELSTFLFEKYGTVDVNVLFEKINSAKDLTGLNLDDLKSTIPISNWERYFSPLVDCDDTYLEKRWTKLYDYRCKVAHNNEFRKVDYEETIKLYKEVKEKLQKAIDNLDKIKLSDADKEFVAESIAGTTNELYGVFLNKWKIFTLQVYTILEVNKQLFEKHISGTPTAFRGLERYRHSVLQMARLLRKIRLINTTEFDMIVALNKKRNHMVHESEFVISEVELRRDIEILDEIASELPKSLEERIKKLEEDGSDDLED